MKGYSKVHKLAKFIVCLVNTVLVLLYSQTHMELLLIFVNISYFFGVNTVAYLLESVLHLRHRHDKV